ncbi:MAG TPA: hypothetical protein DCR04_12485 [Flavobacteriales bacterium]|nr:hypothetical protein [Flavobacteriales bacterium]
MTDSILYKLRKHLVSIVAVLFIALVLFGAIFPVDFWGVHYLRFLEFPQKLTISLIAFAAILIPNVLNQNQKTQQVGNPTNWLRQLLPFMGAAIFAFLIIEYPVAYDPYGDAVNFEKNLSKIARMDPAVMSTLFGFSLDAWSGQKTMEALVSLISNYNQITIGEAFKLIDLVCGVGFSFFWIYFLTQQFNNLFLIVTLSIIGLTAPFMLSFFGRVEIYPPALLFLLMWALVLIKYLKSKNLTWLILLIALNILCIKAHPMAVLLLPSTIFLIAAKISQSVQSKLNWPNTLRYVFIPIALVGSVVYFFVFEDHIDDRSLQQNTMQYDHLFLPLFSPDAPLDRYNVLSFNHIWDFLNLIFLWSPAAIFIILTGVLIGKTRSIFDKPEFILIAVPFILFSVLLFVINPILSMPMDWDLYSLPAPFLLILSVLVLGSLKSNLAGQLLPPALAIAVLGSSFIVMHGSKSEIANRLESVAIRVNKTYYEWTMNIIERADSITGLTPDEIYRNREKLDAIMRPNARIGIDREFAELLREQAKYRYKVEKDFDSARKIMKEAVLYDSIGGNNQMTLMEINFLEGNMKQAYLHSTKLLQLKHPSEEQALKMAIHCALEANLFQEALIHSNDYLKTWGDPLVSEVKERIINGNNPQELRFLFSGSSQQK